VDVRLSEEQLALRDSAAQAVGRLAAQTVAGLDDRERAAKLDGAVEASGWRELRVAGEGEAPLASAVEVAIVAEELGRSLADVPFLGPTLAVELRRLTGSPEAADRETVALRGDLSNLAQAGDPGLVAIDAQDAASALVALPSADGTSIGSLPVGAPIGSVDLTRHAAALGTTESASGLEGQVRLLRPEDLSRWLSLGLATTCADLVGTMRGAIELARVYAQGRQQYGKHIGSFQAVQHMLADAYVAMEGSRSVALHAAWAVDALDPDEALAATSLAKAYCARAARNVCEIGIQVHGGIGNTWECQAHVFLRRSLLSSELFGGVDANLTRVLASSGLGGDHGLR
jgi:alkylation response protein AidB-like acyl-CoA dehydrogenase